MKNIVKILSVAAIALAFASCNKEAPSKAQVEKGFKPFAGGLPELTMDAKSVVVDALNGIATINVTVSGLDTKLDSLSVGVLSCLDETFASTSFVGVENPEDGTFAMKAKVSANKTYYLKAVAACLAGATYSNTVKIKVPDIQFWQKLPGQYAAAAFKSDAYGDTYDSNVITIIADEADPEHKCYITDLEPYWYTKYKAADNPGFLFCEATIDNNKKTVTIAQGASYNFSGRTIVGLNSDHMSTATGYSDVVFKAQGDEVLVRENAFVTVLKDGSSEDIYEGNVKYTKK